MLREAVFCFSWRTFKWGVTNWETFFLHTNTNSVSLALLLWNIGKLSSRSSVGGVINSTLSFADSPVLRSALLKSRSSASLHPDTFCTRDHLLSLLAHLEIFPCQSTGHNHHYLKVSPATHSWMQVLVQLQFIDKLHGVIYKMSLTVSTEPIIDLMIECHHYYPTLTCMLTSSNTELIGQTVVFTVVLLPKAKKTITNCIALIA